MNDHIKRILDSIEKVSPEAWKNLVEYTFACAAVEVFVAIVIFSASCAVIERTISGYQKADRYDRDTPIIIGILASIGLIVSVLRLSISLPIAMHPEGYAILSLIGTIAR